jgi:hypothetical protein
VGIKKFGGLSMTIKVVKIKENKNGSALFDIEYPKKLEDMICKYFNKSKFTKKLLQRAIIEGLENYLKEREICEYFDGGCCLNDKEFPEGTPTELSGNYCSTKCKYWRIKNEKNFSN